jgi:hypothetical protein
MYQMKKPTVLRRALFTFSFDSGLGERPSRVGVAAMVAMGVHEIKG